MRVLIWGNSSATRHILIVLLTIEIGIAVDTALYNMLGNLHDVETWFTWHGSPPCEYA